jgi:GPH family glycoside/pentoside/hexuronide:cation symporter
LEAGTAPADVHAQAEGTVGQKLALSTVLAYCAPTFGAGFMFLLVPIHLPNYATDVLLMSPLVMGAILGGSRLWDAIADPIAGHLSDRTRSRLGRRRPWILASIVPMALAYALIWTSPQGLTTNQLTVWMALAVFSFYTASTSLIIPHLAFGAELTSSYHDRTRLFGWRHAIWSAGGLAALLAVWRFTSGEHAPRQVAVDQAVVAAVLTAVGAALAVLLLRERESSTVRAAATPWSAYFDVLQNPHARLILVVYLIESIGAATITTLTQFIARYVVGRPELTSVFICCYFVPTLFSVPLWVWLSRRYGKKNLWLFSMWVTGLSFGALFFLGEGSVLLLVVIAAIAGTAGGCGSVVGPSVQADCIDWDEYVTGERKEGAYFAAWNFALKAAFGITSLWTGLALELSGFQPNVEQSETTQLALRTMVSLVPLACYAIGASLFARFGLGELQHAEIRRALDERAAANA